MNLQLNIANILEAYLLFILVLVTILYIFNKLRDHNRSWSISKSRLMTCKNCGHFFLRRRFSFNDNCPHCGKKSVAFRLPKSEYNH